MSGSKSDFTLHILPNFFIPTSVLRKRNVTDGCTVKALALCEMFTKNGHNTIFYGVGEAKSEVKCTTFVPIGSESIYQSLSEDTKDFTNPRYMSITDSDDSLFESRRNDVATDFFELLNPVLCKKYEDGDIVIHVCDSFPLTMYDRQDMVHVYAGHGGGWCPTPYIIYETVPWMNKHYRDESLHGVKVESCAAIMPWVDPTKFDFNPEKKKDYYLYLARCINIKGVNFFVELAKYHPENKFIVAGGCVHYDEDTQIMTIPDGDDIDFSQLDNVEYVGVVDSNRRRKLLSEAKALIQPTFYFEPCGYNVIEALMSGTPVLTSNHGGFKQTVPHGRVGYRCNSDEWSMFLDSIDNIDPKDCRRYAEKIFDEDRAYQEYLRFFEMISS
jgi:glycosyltransferase involved in cell wall biosynthesis